MEFRRHQAAVERRAEVCFVIEVRCKLAQRLAVYQSDGSRDFTNVDGSGPGDRLG